MTPDRDVAIILVVFCIVLACLGEAGGSTHTDQGNENGFSNRMKRSNVIGKAALDGIKAVNKLLKGATEMGIHESKLYSKGGTYLKAVRDFNRLKLKSVTKLDGPNGEKIRTGVKGDREFILHNGGASGTASIEVKKLWEFNGEKLGRITQKVVYQKKDR